MSERERAERLWIMPLMLRARMMASEMDVETLAEFAQVPVEVLNRYLAGETIPYTITFEQWRAIRFLLLPVPMRLDKKGRDELLSRASKALLDRDVATENIEACIDAAMKKGYQT